MVIYGLQNPEEIWHRCLCSVLSVTPHTYYHTLRNAELIHLIEVYCLYQELDGSENTGYICKSLNFVQVVSRYAPHIRFRFARYSTVFCYSALSSSGQIAKPALSGSSCIPKNAIWCILTNMLFSNVSDFHCISDFQHWTYSTCSVLEFNQCVHVWWFVIICMQSN